MNNYLPDLIFIALVTWICFSWYRTEAIVARKKYIAAIGVLFVTAAVAHIAALLFVLDFLYIISGLAIIGSIVAFVLLFRTKSRK